MDFEMHGMWQMLRVYGVSNIIVSRPNVMLRQYLHCTTHCIPIDLMFEESVYLKIIFYISTNVCDNVVTNVNVATQVACCK